jgi:hypothetical protein
MFWYPEHSDLVAGLDNIMATSWLLTKNTEN